MNDRLRVLASAYACEPGSGSEPGTGWNWVQQIARFHDVWVITRENNRPKIEQRLAEQPADNIQFVYYDLPSWARFWKKKQRGARLYYYLWQIGAYFVARKLHREIRFELIQHVTLGNYWIPSFLALLPVPFVWGPVGGGESASRSFWRSFSFRGKVFEMFRDLARWWSSLDPFVGQTAKRATFTLATTRQTEERLLRLGCKRTGVISKMALSQEEIEQLGSLGWDEGETFRVVSLGRILHWKGFELGLRAFARFHRDYPASEAWFIGNGPERKRLERLTEELGMQDSVVFWGSLPRAEALSKLAQCHALVHPSLHESGGWVCLEGMAAGRPVVCLDLGGPGANVTDESGIKVAAVSPEQVVNDLAHALRRLADDRGLCQRMGQAGRRRIQEKLCWDKSGSQLADIYRSLALHAF